MASNDLTKTILKPTQDLYLNVTAFAKARPIERLKPTQDLYLNLI